MRWLIDEDDDATPVALPKFDWKTTSPVDAGVQMREAIGLNLYEQGGWKDFSAALWEWRTIFDELGVLVFSLQLGKNEIRGFSAWDDYAPVVAVNTAYVPGARIFTMAHELAHLVTRTDSACFDWVRPSSLSDGDAELWCERFAAAFLLPPLAFKGYLAQVFGVNEKVPVVSFEQTRKISSKLKISSRATALALIRAKLAPATLYDLVDREAKQVDYPPDRSGGGGLKIVPKRIGQYGTRAPRALVEAAERGTIGQRDVADYLGMTLNDLDDLRGALSAQPGATR
jgi:Predicted Zn peptidase